jgi:3-methyladenine DNA glycosylase AlkD
MPQSTNLHHLLSLHANASNARAMSAYMKNHFAFFGIKATERRLLFKSFVAGSPQISKAEVLLFVRQCWLLPEREMQLCAMEILVKHRKVWDADYFELFEEMITTKSWWDTVDFIAVNLVGDFLSRNQTLIKPSVEKWMQSENRWLQRTAILFQLKYKSKTDVTLLFSLCNRLSSSKEFFIRKAIGWALREYSKTDANAVKQYVAGASIHPFSKREALKWLNRKPVL